MQKEIRKTGIDFIGSVPWGTHFCQFYQTKEDLIDILVPYFKAGVESNEFCMWVTAEPLGEQEAKEALSKAVPDLEHYLAEGQLEIVPHTAWYLKDGAFDSRRVLNAWVDKLNHALAKGYDGMRLTGNTFWLEKKDWASFTDYEADINRVIGKYKMLALCTYCLDKCGASEIIDVISNHEFALIKREGNWEIIESAVYRETKEALREREQFLSIVLKTIPSGVVMIEKPDDRIIYVNNRAVELYGVDPRGLEMEKHSTGIKVLKLDGDTFPAEELPARRALLHGEVVRNQELVIERPDGTRIVVLASAAPVFDELGEPVAAVGIFDDVTERKQIEGKLAHLASFPELNPIFVLEIDKIGNVSYANPAIKKRFPALAATGNKHAYLADLPQVMQSQQGLESKYITREVKVGQQYYEQVICSVGDGQSVRIYGYDITERKQSEESLRIMTQELARSNAELEQFAYIASHDLQEPLRMVSSYVHLLAKRYQGKLDQDADDFINYARDGAARMQRLINDLLAYSRIGTHGKRFEEISLEAVLTQALENLKLAIADNQATVTYGPLPTVKADAGQLTQLFQNLLDNAIKFHSEAPPRIHVSAERKEGEWVCAVRDNGIGIASEYLSKVFILFQRLHSREKYPGTGIGLAICRRIVEKHGGRIWVESRPGVGSTFYFTILAIAEKE